MIIRYRNPGTSAGNRGSRGAPATYLEVWTRSRPLIGQLARLLGKASKCFVCSCYPATMFTSRSANTLLRASNTQRTAALPTLTGPLAGVSTLQREFRAPLAKLSRAERRRLAPIASATLVAPAPSAQATKTEHHSIDDGNSADRITFKIHYSTTFGEVLKLVGNWPGAGSWNADQGKQMQWTDGDTWVASLPLTPDQKYEYKFVVVNSRNGTKRWEEGPNRTLDVSTLKDNTLDMEWSSLAVSVNPGSDDHPVSREELAARAKERQVASELVFKAFSAMVSSAKPGSLWAAEEPEDLDAAAAAEAEFAARAAALSKSMASGAHVAAGKAPQLAKA